MNSDGLGDVFGFRVRAVVPIVEVIPWAGVRLRSVVRAGRIGEVPGGDLGEGGGGTHTPGVLDRLARKASGITAKYFGHVFILDFSRAPRCVGTEDLWIGGVLDVFSRALVATKTCAGQPTAKFATRLLDAAIENAGRAPKHSITDQGAQFKSKRFKKWLKRHGIKHRFGAVGKHGSIAFLERCWRTLKEWVPWTWCIFGTAASLERHVEILRRWYNEERPHTSLCGDSPNDVRFGKRRRLRAIPATGKWKLSVRWTGPTHDLPVVRLRKVA